MMVLPGFSEWQEARCFVLSRVILKNGILRIKKKKMSGRKILPEQFQILMKHAMYLSIAHITSLILQEKIVSSSLSL